MQLLSGPCVCVVTGCGLITHLHETHAAHNLNTLVSHRPCCLLSHFFFQKHTERGKWTFALLNAQIFIFDWANIPRDIYFLNLQLSLHRIGNIKRLWNCCCVSGTPTSARSNHLIKHKIIRYTDIFRKGFHNSWCKRTPCTFSQALLKLLLLQQLWCVFNQWYCCAVQTLTEAKILLMAASIWNSVAPLSMLPLIM